MDCQQQPVPKIVMKESQFDLCLKLQWNHVFDLCLKLQWNHLCDLWLLQHLVLNVLWGNAKEKQKYENLFLVVVTCLNLPSWECTSTSICCWMYFAQDNAICPKIMQFCPKIMQSVNSSHERKLRRTARSNTVHFPLHGNLSFSFAYF